MEKKMKVRSITFADKQHRIEGMHIGPILRANEKVSLYMDIPFVECHFAQDPGRIHMVPMYGISDICIETDVEDGK
jgi:hypothetical protein